MIKKLNAGSLYLSFHHSPYWKMLGNIIIGFPSIDLPGLAEMGSYPICISALEYSNGCSAALTPRRIPNLIQSLTSVSSLLVYSVDAAILMWCCYCGPDPEMVNLKFKLREYELYAGRSKCLHVCPFFRFHSGYKTLTKQISISERYTMCCDVNWKVNYRQFK